MHYTRVHPRPDQIVVNLLKLEARCPALDYYEGICG